MWFLLPPSLVSVAQFSFFPQPYQIQLVLVTLRLAVKGGPGGIRASDLKAPSLNCLVVHPVGPPKSKIRESKIQNPKSKLFWPDFGDFWILDRYGPNCGFWGWILGFGFWILDFGFWTFERYPAVLFVQILDFGFWIWNQILDATLHKIRILSTQTRVGGYYWYIFTYIRTPTYIGICISIR